MADLTRAEKFRNWMRLNGAQCITAFKPQEWNRGGPMELWDWDGRHSLVIQEYDDGGVEVYGQIEGQSLVDLQRCVLHHLDMMP